MVITHTMGDHLQERHRSTELKYYGKDTLSDTVISERPPTSQVVDSYRAAVDFYLNYD